MNEVKLLIGGKIVQARSAATFERRNPVSGAVVTRSAAAAEADAIAAVEAAAAAFPAWVALGPGGDALGRVVLTLRRSQTAPRHYPF
jgi:benzaldehyde dehydrogenase (NAD)